jgi:hypothetical protein
VLYGSQDNASLCVQREELQAQQPYYEVRDSLGPSLHYNTLLQAMRRLVGF